ncbi:MAG: hypothetical protein KDC71_10555 [Acidobacteria bacterium]|nr:hypothetical protein [Acidobacteriota bacterium]
MKKLAFFLFFGMSLLAQSQVTGPLVLRWVDQGPDCQGLGHLVDIYADTTGLTGMNNELVGINAFVLSIESSQSFVLTTLHPGFSPINWQYTVSQPPLTNQIIIAGWSTDTNAPNEDYHLARLLLSGAPGTFSLSLMPGSQVASRLAGPGNGPDLIPLQLPNPITVQLPVSYNLFIGGGISAWHELDLAYDLVPPYGTPIDMLDLVKLVYCTPP